MRRNQNIKRQISPNQNRSWSKIRNKNQRINRIVRNKTNDHVIFKYTINGYRHHLFGWFPYYWTISSTSLIVNYDFSSHSSFYSHWIPFSSNSPETCSLLRLFIYTQVRKRLDKPSSSRTFKESLVAIIICFFPLPGDDFMICWRRWSKALLYLDDKGTY